MADTPNDWMSYADYLGLNEASLRELEAAANQQRAQADDAVQGALGASYQEAQRDVEAGGQGSITATASYGDFLKAQRAAQQANAPQGSGYEGAARASFQMGAPTYFTEQRNQMQGNLDQRRADIGVGKANVDKWNKDRKSERDAQDKAFAEAEDKMGPVWKDRHRYGQYSDAVKNSYDKANAGAVPRGAPRVRVISEAEYNSYNGGK